MQRDVGTFYRLADIGERTFNGLSEENVIRVDTGIGAGIARGLLSDCVRCHQQKQKHDSNSHACDAPEVLCGTKINCHLEIKRPAPVFPSWWMKVYITT